MWSFRAIPSTVPVLVLSAGLLLGCTLTPPSSKSSSSKGSSGSGSSSGNSGGTGVGTGGGSGSGTGSGTGVGGSGVAAPAVTFDANASVARGGSTLGFTYSVTGTADTLTLAYAQNGTTFQTISSLSPSSSSYIWNVPGGENAVAAKFRLTASSSNGLSVQSLSRSVRIDSLAPNAPTLNLLSGSPTHAATIDFTTANCTDTTQLFVTHAGVVPSLGDAGWITCAAAPTALQDTLAADGNYSVTVYARDLAGNVSAPSTLSVNYDGTVPNLTLDNLTGGQVIRAGAAYGIAFTASDSHFGPTPISIERSTDSGASWALVTTAGGVANTSPYSWSVPSGSAPSSRIRVTATDTFGNSITKTSTSNFAIDGDAPTLSLTSLTGGQTISGGTSVNISWTATDAHFGATPIAIDYSTNSGSTWTAITAGVTNAGGSYAWTVPSISTTGARVRVTATDIVSNATTVTSTSNFTITTVGPADHLAKISGDSQSGVAGAALSSPIVARVEDSANQPVSGATVTFTVSAGGGSRTVVTGTSGADGKVSANWTLGATAGALQALTASATGLTSLVFSATATYGAATKLVLTGPASATAGTCSGALTITRQDVNSNPASPGSSLTVALSGVGAGSFFTTSDCSGGSVTSTSIASGSSAASVYFRDTTAESLSLAASASGLTGATLSFTSLTGAADHLAKISGDAQTAVAGAALGASLVARIEDAQNNPVSGVAATFTVSAGGGSRTVTTGTSGADGKVSATWTVGTTAGSLQALTVASSGLASLTYSATATSGAATKLVLSGPASGTAGTCTTSFTLSRQDVNSNNTSPASSLAITLSGVGAGSFFSASDCLSGATSTASISSGQSSTTLYFRDATAESLTLAADASGITGATSAFASLVGAADHLAKISGDTQTAIAGAALSSAIVARVEDAQNNPVSGVTVTFTVAAGGGSRSVVTGTSGADGKVSANWTLGPIAGSAQTLTASSNPLSSIDFSATSTYGAVTKLILSGPSTAASATCSTAITLTREDANSNPASPASSLAVTLAGVGSGSFYTMSDCLSGSVTSTTIASGQAAKTLYYKDATAESVTLTAGVSGLTSGTLAFSTTAGAADHLARYSGDAQTGVAGSSLASSIVARVEDASNNPVSGVAVTFTVSAGAGSRTNVTTTSGADGLVSANWTLGIFAGATQTLTAASIGLAPVDFSATSTYGSVTKLALSGPTTVVAATCSAAITLSRQDANSNNASPASSLSITLSGVGAGSFYTASDCLSGSVTSTTIASGQSSKTFYFRDTSAETLTLAVNASGITGATLAVSITAGAAHHIAKFSGDAQSAVAGETLASAVVGRVEDISNNPVTGVTVIFAVTAGGGSQVTATGTSGADGKVSANWTVGTTAGATQTLTASSSGLTGASFSATATFGAATKVVVTGPSSGVAAACAGPFTITRQDTNSNPASPGAAATLSFSGLGSGNFYSDASCGSGLGASVDIPASASSVQGYFKDATAESLTITVASTGLTTGTIAFASIAGAAHHLTKISGDAQSAVAGATLASPVVARVEDASNNPVSGVAVTFTVSAGGGSRAVVTGTSGADGKVSANWTLGTTAGTTQTLATASTGLTTINFSATATFGSATKLVWTGPSTAISGTCTSAFTIARQDANSNATSPPSITNVSLSGVSSGHFFTASDCLSGQVSTTTIASGASSTTVYFKDASAENVALAADATGLTQGTILFASTAGSASVITKYSGDNQTGVAGTALGSAVVGRVEDANGNPVSGVAVTFTVSAGGGSRSVVTGTSAANGQVSANWTVGTTAGGLQTLTASSTGLASALFNATATFGASTKLVWSGGSASLSTSTCSAAFTVKRQDVNSNDASPASSLAVILSGAGTGGSYYAANDCSGSAITSATIASAASGTTLYYQATSAGSNTLNAAATSHTSGTFSITVTAPAAITVNPLTRDYGNVSVGAGTSGMNFDFTNSGGVAATGCTAPAISGANAADYQINADGCGTADLAAGATCQIYVSAQPSGTTLGTRTATVTRTCTNASGTTTVNGLTMQVVPPPPNLLYNPSSFAFGSVGVGGSVSRTLGFTNYGGDAAGCGSFSVTNTTDFGVDSTTCTASLAANASCTVTIHSSPAATGSKTGNLSRTCTTGGTVTAAITATGVSASTPYLTSIAHSGNRYYYGGQKFTLTTTWSAVMTVTGTPRIPVKVGSTNYYANYVSGSGTNTLVFSMTITSAMGTDNDGLDVISPIALNSGTIKDGSAVAAALSFGPPDATQVYVEGATPGVVSATTSATSLVTGNTLSLTLTYAANMTVSGGPPHIAVNLSSGSTIDVVYASGTGSTSLVFTRTITSGDYDATGAKFGGAVNNYGGTIRNSGGNDAATNFTPPANTFLLNAPVSFTQHWPFDFSTTSSYSYDTTKIDFAGGVCRLTATDQLDDTNTCSGFGDGTGSSCGGIFTGSTWDGSGADVRINSSTATTGVEYDASWVPQWSTLLGYWKLNNNWNDSKGSNNGTASGATFTTSRKIGTHAARFNGSSDYAAFADLRPTTAITMSLWTKPSAINSYGKIIVHPYTNSSWNDPYESYGLTQSNGGSGQPYFELTTNSGVYGGITGSTKLAIGKWAHLVGTYDGATMKLYVNGVLESSAAKTGVISYSTGTELLFGQRSTASGQAGEYYAGDLDDVGIWSTALSATEVQTLYSRQSSTYAATFTSRVMDALATAQNWSSIAWKTASPYGKALPDGTSETTANYPSLVGSTGSLNDDNLMSGIWGLYHLDEPAGTSGTGSIKDSSGNNHHLTPSGSGTTFGQPGKFGPHAIFDGNGVLTSTTSTGISGTAARTISAWVKVNPVWTSDPGGIAGIGNSSSPYSQLFFLTGSLANNFNFGTWIYGSDVPSTIPSRDAQWHHVLSTYDGTTIRLYVDGVSAGTGSTTLATQDTPFYIGKSSVGTGINAAIDEVAIWTRALDAKEALQVYRRGANRVRMQVRTCTASDCSDDPSNTHWKGPDGTNTSYFTEEYNVSTPSASPSGTVNAASPNMTFANFTSPPGTARYFQYRTFLESDDTGTGCDYGSGATWCSPELKNVSVGPVHYDSSSPTIIGKTGVSFITLSSFVQTLGTSCASGVTLNLGIGTSYSTATWYWWDSAANSGSGGWVTADGTFAKSSSAATVNAHVSSFATQVSTGTVYFKAFLGSSGSSACEIDDLAVGGTQ